MLSYLWDKDVIYLSTIHSNLYQADNIKYFYYFIFLKAIIMNEDYLSLFVIYSCKYYVILAKK